MMSPSWKLSTAFPAWVANDSPNSITVGSSSKFNFYLNLYRLMASLSKLVSGPAPPQTVHHLLSTDILDKPLRLIPSGLSGDSQYANSSVIPVPVVYVTPSPLLYQRPILRLSSSVLSPHGNRLSFIILHIINPAPLSYACSSSRRPPSHLLSLLPAMEVPPQNPLPSDGLSATKQSLSLHVLVPFMDTVQHPFEPKPLVSFPLLFSFIFYFHIIQTNPAALQPSLSQFILTTNHFSHVLKPASPNHFTLPLIPPLQNAISFSK